MKNKWSAPQKPLRSSWRSEVFKKPKVRGVWAVTRSLSGRANILERVNGNFISRSHNKHSNVY